ncbi:MAG: Omp28-related outer membrane protein [Bacteroidales bacterium]|nr:Omp28-related outer membrane protein [Bacteroidales bacterium]
MNKIFSMIAMAAVMLFAMGCDKIDNPHKPYTPSGGNKTVLIKDFTGARCVNCPAAAATAHELQHQLGEDRVFVMSVHAGYLAQPIGKFPDFTTPEGTVWYNDNSANPLFSVDHVALTEGNTLNESQLDTPVSDALAEPQLFDIVINNTYNELTRSLSVENRFNPTGDGQGEYYATVCLLEDSIVGRQVIPGGVDTAYVFRNVFRGTLNGADGELVSNGAFYVDDSFTTTCGIELDTTFNADQCYVLTYIYDKIDGKILQTAMRKVR